MAFLPLNSLAEFDRQVRIMFADQAGLRNISVTKGTIIIYSAPPVVANKTAIGADLWQISELRKNIELLIPENLL